VCCVNTSHNATYSEVHINILLPLICTTDFWARYPAVLAKLRVEKSNCCCWKRVKAAKFSLIVSPVISLLREDLKVVL